MTELGKNRLHALAAAILLFAVGVVFIPARLFIGDPYAWREEAINIVVFHQLKVDPSIANAHGETNQYFTLNPVTMTWYSKYGVMSGLLNVLPLYVEYKVTGKLPAWDSKYRRLCLGFFYSVLGALFAFSLFQLCGHYGVSRGSCWLFLLSSVFCTYLGYYLRATNSEAYQLLFFTLFFERAAAYRESGFRAHGKAYAAWFFLLCLVHVKVSHMMVACLFAAALVLECWRGGGRRRELTHLLALVILPPFLLLTATLAFMNLLKFGAPLGTGYTMWQAEAFVHDIPPLQMVKNVFFTWQWGVPIHFPLLLLAPFGARSFYRRFPFDGFLALSIFLAAFVVIGSMPVWKGEWAYGPRYFLFALPALSLPALLCFERFFSEERRKPAVGALLACTALVLSVSAFFQFQVARLDPFFCYWARPNIAAYNDKELTDYWNKTNFAWIATIAWNARRDPGELWWMKRLKEVVPPLVYAGEKKRLEAWLKRTNFYWWSPKD